MKSGVMKSLVVRGKGKAEVVLTTTPAHKLTKEKKLNDNLYFVIRSLGVGCNLVFRSFSEGCVSSLQN